MAFHVSAWLADLTRPLTGEASAEAARPDLGDPLSGVPEMVGREDWQWSMVITQTCDLARTQPGKTLVQVCPVYEVEQGTKSSGERPRFVRVPWHLATNAPGRVWVADLQEITTAERSLLPAGGDCGSPNAADERRKLAYLIARYFGRPALPDPVSNALKNLTGKVRNRYGNDDSPMSTIFNAVDQVRIQPDPDFDTSGPWNLTVHFLVPERLGDFREPEYVRVATRNTGVETDRLASAIKEHHATAAEGPIERTIWTAAIAELLTNTTTGANVPSIVARVSNTLNADDWNNSDELDLAYLSNALEGDGSV